MAKISHFEISSGKQKFIERLGFYWRLASRYRPSRFSRSCGMGLVVALSGSCGNNYGLIEMDRKPIERAVALGLVGGLVMMQISQFEISAGQPEQRLAKSQAAACLLG